MGDIISGGIVLYNPDMARLKENVDSVIKQVDCLVLVDNASKNIEEVKALFGGNEKITILLNDENKGIAAALNQILNWAEKMGAEWVLTLDQDSVCAPDMVEKLWKYKDVGKIGILCPRLIHRKRPEKGQDKKEEKEYRTATMCPTSGSLTNIAAMKEIGGFDEKLFIDEVDEEACIRLRIAGYCILKVNTAELLHDWGNQTEVYLFPRLSKILPMPAWKEPVYPNNHSNLRKYYIMRNNIYVHRKYKKQIDLKRKRYYFRKSVRLWFLAEKVTWGMIKAVVKGAWDGYRMPLN